MKLAFAFIVEEDDLVSKRLRHLKCHHGSNDLDRGMIPTNSKAKGEVITKVVAMEEVVAVMEVMAVAVMEEVVINIEEYKAQDGREIKSIEQVIFFCKKIYK